MGTYNTQYNKYFHRNHIDKLEMTKYYFSASYPANLIKFLAVLLMNSYINVLSIYMLKVQVFFFILLDIFLLAYFLLMEFEIIS